MGFLLVIAGLGYIIAHLKVFYILNSIQVLVCLGQWVNWYLCFGLLLKVQG